MGTKGRGGEIVQVEGGHILRSIGRKDRHSKVYTAKGPRDRRVRLSAHTAIQFYDVQDRLGYDRPSKAVDWLINKAKTAIDKLEELPPWNPMVSQNEGPNGAPLDQRSDPSSGYPFHGDPIDDTMKSFFPISSGMNFQSYPDDIMSRTSLQIDNQDLCLSLHAPPADHCLFPAAAPANFEGNYPRMVGWDGEIKPGFFINSQTMAQPNMLCQQNLGAFSQREPLQSSFSPLVRAWNDLPLPTSEHNNTTQPIHHFSVSNTQFGSERFSGFQVPARIHGEEPSSGSANSHQ